MIERSSLPMLRVLFDDEIFSREAASIHAGGIQRYFAELIGRLRQSEGFEVALPLVVSNDIYVRRMPGTRVLRFLPGRHFKGKTRVIRAINRWRVRRELRRERHDLVHLTYYDESQLDLLRGRPFVVTIHDMIPELLPEFRDDRSGLVRAKRRLAEAAARIVCVSETTRNDVARLYGLDPARIDIVGSGPSDSVRYRPSLGAPALAPGSFVLFVGRRGGYKNFAAAAGALAGIMAERPELRLVCVGGGALQRAELAPFEEQGCAERVHHVAPADEELAWYYAHAQAFVFPSRYEGFGIPVLEAFVNRCPAVLSTGGSLPEIGGEAALYFDPESPGELRSALERVMDDAALRLRLGAAGEERAKAFSWERSVAALKKSYLRAVGDACPAGREG
jgi:glycosyltransferase involved in cell wall biosynthesis